MKNVYKSEKDFGKLKFQGIRDELMVKMTWENKRTGDRWYRYHTLTYEEVEELADRLDEWLCQTIDKHETLNESRGD